MQPSWQRMRPADFNTNSVFQNRHLLSLFFSLSAFLSAFLSALPIGPPRATNPLFIDSHTVQTLAPSNDLLALFRASYKLLTQ